MFDMMFGFREMSASNLAGKYMIPKQYKVGIRQAELIWKEIIQTLKIRQVVIEPAVPLGNILSNMVIHVVEGVPLDNIVKDTTLAIRAAKQYRELLSGIQRLEHEIDSGIYTGKRLDNARAKLAKLKVDQEINPVHELIEEGMFTSIVEDLQPGHYTKKEKLKGYLEDKTGKFLSDEVKSNFSEFFMLQGSENFEAAAIFTQYSDFVARFVQMKHDKSKGMSHRDAVHRAMDTFIHYDLPNSPIQDTLNAFGFALYTKFLFRIQRVIMRQFAERPASATLSLLFQQYITSLSDITGSFLMFSGTARYSMFPLSRALPDSASNLLPLNILSWPAYVLGMRGNEFPT